MIYNKRKKALVLKLLRSEVLEFSNTRSQITTKAIDPSLDAQDDDTTINEDEITVKAL